MIKNLNLLNQIVEFRLGAWSSSTLVSQASEVFDFIKKDNKIKSICVYDASARRVMPFNGYDSRLNRDLDFWSLVKRKWGSDMRVANMCSYLDFHNKTGVFVMSMTDAAYWTFNEINCGYPILQFVRDHNDKKAILFPLDYKYMGIGSINFPETVEKIDTLFHLKKDIAVWRGRLSGTNRIDGKTFHVQNIIQMLLSSKSEEEFKSIIEPHLHNHRLAICDKYFKSPDVDAAIVDPAGLNKTTNPTCLEWSYARRFIGEKLIIAEQLKYKYIICLPGNDYPSGLYWALVSNSVVLMPIPKWSTAMDFSLTPWVHYIPISDDLVNLHEIIAWCRDNEKNVLEIIGNAKDYCKVLSDVEMRNKADEIVIDVYESLVRPADLPDTFSFATDRRLSDIRWSQSKIDN